MNVSMILMIVFGLLVLFYGFVAYKCAANWLIGEILLLVGIFLAGAGLAVLVAMSLKTHQAWQARNDTLEAELKLVVEEVELREHGDLLGTGSEIVSLPAAKGNLNRYLVDRGRVWRNVVPADIQPGAITLDLRNWGELQCVRAGMEEDGAGIVPQPDPAAGDAAVGEDGAAAPRGDVRPHQIVQNSVLFIFREANLKGFNNVQKQALFPDSDLPQQDLPGACRLPVFYLGQFRVIEAAEEAITVQPLNRLDPNQQQFIQAGQGATWALYDVLPRDGHDIFAGLDQQALESILQIAPDTMAPVDYENMLAEYLRDLQPAAQTDAPERIEQEVEFTREHTVAVDQEGDTPGIESSFDATGRAVLAQLRLGHPVPFVAEEKAWFDGETAKRLVNDGVAKFTDEPPRYRRALRSYQDLFRDQRKQLDAFDAQAAVVSTDTRSMVEAHTKVRGRNEYRTQEKGELAEDLAKFEQELSIINSYVQTLEAEVAQLEQDIRSTKVENERLVARH